MRKGRGQRRRRSTVARHHHPKAATKPPDRFEEEEEEEEDIMDAEEEDVGWGKKKPSRSPLEGPAKELCTADNGPGTASESLDTSLIATELDLVFPTETIKEGLFFSSFNQDTFCLLGPFYPNPTTAQQRIGES